MQISRVRTAVLIASIILGVCTAVWVGAGTTGIISGVVKSAEDGTPVSGANVIVGGTKLSTVTDENGYFVITNVAPGEYEITAEMVGLATELIGNVQVAMDTTARVDFEMRQEAIPEAEVIVTRPRPMISTDVANTLNLLNSGQEDLTRADPASVGAVPGVLSTLPGVIVDPNGMGAVHMRGGRADQIGYYLEGIPVTDPNMGFFSTNLFTTGVNKFQTYPGGFGAEYGNAISGVLNEVKKTGSQFPGLGIHTEGGNQGFRSTKTEIGGGIPDDFNYYVGTVLQRNDMDGGPILRRQRYSDSVAKLVWPSTDDTVTFFALQGSLAGLLDTYHNVGNYNQPTPYEPDFMRQRYAIGAVSWSHNFSPRSFVRVQPYYIYSTTVQNMMGGFGAFLNAWSAQRGVQLMYTSQLNEQHLLKVGGSMLDATNSYYMFYGFPYYRADVNTFQTALFAQDQIRLNDHWTAEAGARFEGIKYDRTGNQWVPGSGYSGTPIPDVAESSITPRLGLTYSVDPNTAWKASWGQYTKFLPSSSVQAVYFDPDDPFSEAMMSGLGSTAPQRNTSMELSFEKQLSNSLACRVTPFHAKYENLGEYVDEAGISTYRNLGQGKSTGVEVAVRKKMSHNWSGWLSYTYAQTKANRADAGFLNNFFYTSWDQRHTMSLVTDYRTGPWAHTVRADLGSGRADMATYDPTLQQRARPHFVVTYTVSLNLPKGSALADSIYLSVYNLFGNRQALQYSWDWMGVRSVDSTVPSRFISFGFGRAY